MAQTNKTDANIFGHVVDKQSGEHLPYINIMVKGTSIGTATDATGHFHLNNLPTGKLTIVAQSIGYMSQEKVVELEKGKMLELNFERFQQVRINGLEGSYSQILIDGRAVSSALS